MEKATSKPLKLRFSIRDLLWSALVLAVTIAIMAWLLLSPAKVAWNSGARERLAESLKMISLELIKADVKSNGTTDDPKDLNLHNPIAGAEHAELEGALAARYCLTVNWHRNGAYEQIRFCPVAITPKLAIDSGSNAKRQAQIVMVPIETTDIPSLLGSTSGASDSKLEKILKSRLQEIKTLFTKQDIGDAATLMSDGTVEFVGIDDLRN